VDEDGPLLPATQWADYLVAMGHSVDVVHAYHGERADALLALHASRSHDAIEKFQRTHPGRPVVVVLSGSDIYPEPDEKAIDSLRRADRIVVLQPRATGQIPREFHDRVRCIVQAAPEAAPLRAPLADPLDALPQSGGNEDRFDVGVVAHLRAVKDPLRAAAAARLLPDTSRIRVRLAGGTLDPEFGERAEREQAENDRFFWLGELDAAATRRFIEESQLIVVSSYSEGGARVMGESIVAGTPLLAARNDSSRAHLGDDYPGLYEAGNTEELAVLMERAESRNGFLDGLKRRITPLVAKFDPQREQASLRELMTEIEGISKSAHEHDSEAPSRP